jgi:hypothetical protein
MKPNANASDIVDTIDLKTEQLSKNDVVIFCGGMRDIARNNSKLGLTFKVRPLNFLFVIRVRSFLG